ncbi:MAG: hypothetical protein NUV55_02535 [Sulfuricaulis sp.]|uniref:hypothetical protein n=1 Tax=Sulfuricaulis sp. TaxID=2003553 RepID=UPI0025FE06A9|nr:hypothetical protein [Sulfuricaulis sp.]MCR4346070.1 hypothetical protein [Sulfuricaulis sp.]
MEFFAIADKPATAETLQARLDVASLASWCASISQVFSHDGDTGEIFCVWGQFIVHRERIRGGVRFTLPKCPNGFAWTVTTGFPPAPDKVVIHCTINRREHDSGFIATIEKFADDWRRGLSILL